MQPVNSDPKYAPPRMIPSIVEGFNAITENIYLILFPLFFDMFLWLGPFVSVKKYFLPQFLNTLESSPELFNNQPAGLVESTRLLWTEIISQFNLLFSLRTLPIGVPSLMISILGSSNPLGDRIPIELSTGTMIITWPIVFLFVGFLLGSIYFALTANAIKKSDQSSNLSKIFKNIVQSFLLTVILVVAALTLSVPVICLLSSLLLILPSLGTLPFLVAGMLSVWIILPLVFSPHGIFFGELKATTSIVTSFRLVRSLMSSTGLFFIILILLGYGLDILWVTPGTSSWMLLVGIFGHAFISSGLLAASFVYYEKGLKWLQVTRQTKKEQEEPASIA
jgi:hypothetical protein